MNDRNNLWIFGIILLVIFNFAMFSKNTEYKKLINSTYNYSKTITGIDCPDAKGGSDDAYLQIKYFYSKFCPWCIKEEPILNRLVQDYGNLVHIDWINTKKCAEMVDQYQISGVPTFVFSLIDNRTEYSHYGFIYEKDLLKFVCNVTGGC